MLKRISWRQSKANRTRVSTLAALRVLLGTRDVGWKAGRPEVEREVAVSGQELYRSILHKLLDTAPFSLSASVRKVISIQNKMTESTLSELTGSRLWEILFFKS